MQWNWCSPYSPGWGEVPEEGQRLLASGHWEVHLCLESVNLNLNFWLHPLNKHCNNGWPVGWASTLESPARAITIVPYVLQLHTAMHCYIPFFDPLLFPCLLTTIIPFCTYYSRTTKTSPLCQLVLNYDRFMYSPQRLSPAVQLWGMFPMFPPTTYYTCTYKSCRHAKLQVNILQRLSPTIQLWDMLNYMTCQCGSIACTISIINS